MVKKENEVRKKWMLVRMNQVEYDAFYSLYNQSTCRSVSEYFRKVVLKKLVTFNIGTSRQMKFWQVFQG